MAITVNEPINGKDYEITVQGTDVKVDMLGPEGGHVHFRCRVFRVGLAGAVFNQRSDFREDLDREAIGASFNVTEGGYYFYIDQPQGQPSAVVAGVFVVTP